MTLFSQFKNKWWSAREESLKKEFAQREIELLKDLSDKEAQANAEIERKKKIISDELESLEKLAKENELYEKLVSDRRIELEKSNHELKEQIRIIEAKARPDEVWVTAFTSGFNKAWDIALTLQKEGFDRLKDKIKNDAIDETIKSINRDVDKEVKKRMKLADTINIKNSDEIIIKINDLEERKKFTEDKLEILQLTNYINALNWILNDDKKIN